MKGCEFMKTECPFCNQHYEVEDELIDKVVECPQCQKQFTVVPLMQENISPLSSYNESDKKVKKIKFTKKQVVIAVSSLFVSLVLSLVLLYIFNYPFKRWVKVYCFNDHDSTRFLAYDHAQRKEWEKAKKLYFRALNIAKEKNDRFAISDCYCGLSNMLLEQKYYSQVIRICELWLEFNEFGANETMGKAYEALQDYRSAFDSYCKCIRSAILKNRHQILTVQEKSSIKKEDIFWHVDNLIHNWIIFKIALWYTYGQGCEKDLTKAANLWTYLANRDDYYAMYNLGLCYLRGEGVIQNANIAFNLFKEAADNGNKSAMELLSECYEYGWGCNVDKSAAKYWKGLSEKENKE